MSAIILLISVSLFVATGFLVAFFLAVKAGQFDDDVTPAVRILFDNEIINTPSDTTDSNTPNKTS